MGTAAALIISAIISAIAVGGTAAYSSSETSKANKAAMGVADTNFAEQKKQQKIENRLAFSAENRAQQTQNMNAAQWMGNTNDAQKARIENLLNSNMALQNITLNRWGKV